MNGSQELKIGFCLVEVFRFGGELMLYLVVFDVNIPYRQDELFQMSNWTGMRTVHKHGGMAQSVEHIVHIMGRGAEHRQRRMKRGGSVVSNKSCERQRSRTPIANLTERAKRSETVGSSPTVTTTRKPL